MRILILDDLPFLAESMALSLKARGYCVEAFTSPQQVLETIGPNDTLLTDFHMPGMTGLDVARSAYEKGWRGPLFIMSGHRAGLMAHLAHPLLQAVLQKPFSTDELLRVLGEPSSNGSS